MDQACTVVAAVAALIAMIHLKRLASPDAPPAKAQSTEAAPPVGTPEPAAGSAGRP